MPQTNQTSENKHLQMGLLEASALMKTRIQRQSIYWEKLLAYHSSNERLISDLCVVLFSFRFLFSYLEGIVCPTTIFHPIHQDTSKIILSFGEILLIQQVIENYSILSFLKSMLLFVSIKHVHIIIFQFYNKIQSREERESIRKRQQSSVLTCSGKQKWDRWFQPFDINILC